MTRDLLRVRDLTTRFFTEEGRVNAVSGVSFTVQEGEVFGLVGESGAGKSVTALSLLDLVDTPGRITDGEIWYREPDLAAEADDEAVDGDFVDVLALPERVRTSLRGPSFAMIFQDPMSSFDPTVTIGEQIGQAVEVQRRASANGHRGAAQDLDYGLDSMLLDLAGPTRSFVSEESRNRAVSLLDSVGIPDPADRAEQYPHEFSGGMLQRAMIAQALAGEPDLLVADEPTTALDVTIQAQILQLLADLQAEQDMSIVLITHDLGVISQMSDRVGVMYAGEVVEQGTLADIFNDNVHPYTVGLLESVPDLEDPTDHLEPIGGTVPSLLDEEMDDRCYFADRCPKAMRACLEKPPMADAETGEPVPAPGPEDHVAKCVLAGREFDEADALPDDHFEDTGDRR
jgi:peptide/nickel transport system ATP-binding protein